MRNIFTAAGLSFGLLAGSTAASATEIEKIWSADGFDSPESVLVDVENDRLIVSNIDGHPLEADGQGYLSLLGLDGEVIARHWVDGLDAPKGMAISEGRLYVSDLDQVKVIDLDSGEPVAAIDIPDAAFLNDVTAGSDGTVYVSDMIANRIYRIDGDKAELWVEDEALHMPNGILVDGDRLMVAGWGTGMQPDFTTEHPGGLVVIGLDTKEITPLEGLTSIGNLDGVVRLGDAFYVSDWVAGKLYRIDADGELHTVLDMGQGSADIGAGGERIYVPMMNDGLVMAFAVEEH